MALPRELRCKHAAFTGGYACWGALVAAPIVRIKDESGRLEKKLVTAHAQLDTNIRLLSRATRNIKAAQIAIKRLEKRIADRDHPEETGGNRKYASLPDA
jgi:hypothetical protein